jgi:hypothetical protein
MSTGEWEPYDGGLGITFDTQTAVMENPKVSIEPQL